MVGAFLPSMPARPPPRRNSRAISGEMVPQEKKTSLVDLDKEPPSQCATRPGQAAKLGGTVSSSRRGFLKDAGGLGIASLMGAAALLTNSDDAQAKTEGAEG